MKQQEAVLTIDDVCDFLKCSRSTVERLIRKGLPYVAVTDAGECRHRRFLLKSIIQFLRAHEKSVPQIPDQFKTKDERKTQND